MVLVRTPDTFRKLTSELFKRGITFYTYQLKSNKVFRVMLRNLHHSFDPLEIKEAVFKAGYSVWQVFNIKKTRTNKLPPLFIIELEPKENNRDIYAMAYVAAHPHID